MKVAYDAHTDTLSILLRDEASIAESDEDKPDVILDYDAAGNLVSIEVLDASLRVSDARKIEFQTTGWRRGRLVSRRAAAQRGSRRLIQAGEANR